MRVLGPNDDQIPGRTPTRSLELSATRRTGKTWGHDGQPLVSVPGVAEVHVVDHPGRRCSPGVHGKLNSHHPPNGEAEVFSVVSCARSALCLENLMADLELQAKVEFVTDSSARSVAARAEMHPKCGASTAQPCG